MSELPEGWTSAPLRDFGSWGSGGTPKRTNLLYYQNGTIPWLIIGDLNDDVVTSAATHITEEGLDNSSAKLLPVNTLLVAMYGSIGKLGITGIECATNQAIAYCIPDRDLVSLKYLFYCVMNAKSDLISEGKGGAQQNISQTILKAFEVPLAPKNEQKRIVNKLEHLLARVDKAREKLEGIPRFLERFRQSVLIEATSGSLTRNWRDKNNINKPWKNVVLAEVATSRLGKMLDKAKNEGDLVPYLRNLNVRWFDFDLTDIQEMRATPEEVIKLAVNKNDVLICEGGEPGRCAVWRGRNGRFIYQEALHRVRTNEFLLPEWLCYCLKADADSGKLADLFTGTTIKHLTGRSLAKFEFLQPTLAEQKEIVRLVEHLFAFAKRLEARYQEAMKQVEQLTPAILAKAFQGELVPQDPSDDEPAAVLLERIQAVRAAMPKQPRKKSQRKETKKDINQPSLFDLEGVSVKTLNDVGDAHLSQTLKDQKQKGKSLEAKALWLASELNIDDFYVQLSKELSEGLLRVEGDDPAVVALT